MLDILKSDNLKKAFVKFLDSERDGSEVVIQDILKQEDDSSVIDENIMNKRYQKFYEKCQKYSYLFEYNPAEKTALLDTFFGTCKNNKNGSSLKHIIYVNPNVYDRFDFVELLLRECIKLKIDFDFEYTINPNATNGITIYATDQQLSQYKQAMDNIEKYNPQIIKRCGDTPLCAQNLGWYAYERLGNRTVLAIYLGFAKSLIDYYAKYGQDNMPQDFGEQMYKVCNRSREASYYGNLSDDVLCAKFVKNQNKLWKNINSRKLSFDELINNKPLGKFADSHGNDVLVKPDQFVDVLRQQGECAKGHAQKEALFDIIQGNILSAFRQYQISAKIPENLYPNDDANNDDKTVTNTLKRS